MIYRCGAKCLVHLVVVVGPSESLESIRCKSAAGRVQLLSVVLRQLRAKGVDGDDERPAVICIICQEVFRIAKIFTSCPPQKRGSRTSRPPSPHQCSGRSCRRTQDRTARGQLMVMHCAWELGHNIIFC